MVLIWFWNQSERKGSIPYFLKNSRIVRCTKIFTSNYVRCTSGIYSNVRKKQLKLSGLIFPIYHNWIILKVINLEILLDWYRLEERDFNSFKNWHRHIPTTVLPSESGPAHTSRSSTYLRLSLILFPRGSCCAHQGARRLSAFHMAQKKTATLELITHIHSQQLLVLQEVKHRGIQCCEVTCQD